jgi:hypothetical protein
MIPLTWWTFITNAVGEVSPAPGGVDTGIRLNYVGRALKASSLGANAGSNGREAEVTLAL